MSEILVPGRHNAAAHWHDPYTSSGARSILRRFKDDVKAMLSNMEENRQNFEDGRTMLSKSPLAKKIYVAAAMKTLGFIEEHSTENGSCALTLTEKAIKQMSDIKRFL